MSIRRIWVEHLCLAHFLQCSTRPHHYLHWHLVENFITICWIICEIEDYLNWVDSACVVCPLMNGLSHFLNAAPVDKDALFAFCRVLSKLIGLHPLAHFMQSFNTQLPANHLIFGQSRVIQLIQSHRVHLIVLAIGADQVTPHFQLALASVHILLDCVEKWPRVVLWQGESLDHFWFLFCFITCL